MHRLNLLKQAGSPSNDTPQNLTEYIVENIYQKIVDINPYKKLYALFLLESQKNEELAGLKEELTEHWFTQMAQQHCTCPELIGHFNNKPFIEFINTLIVGVELLGIRDIFKSQPDFLKTLIRAYLGTTLSQKENSKNE